MLCLSDNIFRFFQTGRFPCKYLLSVTVWQVTRFCGNWVWGSRVCRSGIRAVSSQPGRRSQSRSLSHWSIVRLEASHWLIVGGLYIYIKTHRIKYLSSCNDKIHHHHIYICYAKRNQSIQIVLNLSWSYLWFWSNCKYIGRHTEAVYICPKKHEERPQPSPIYLQT